MPIVPFRGLASKGIIKDLPAYQLATEAFSDGTNVRFHGGNVTRAPSFRTVVDALPLLPLHVHGYRSPQGSDATFIVGDNQTIQRWAGGSLVDVTPVAYTPASTARAITACSLGQVVYVNDAGNVPFYFGPTSTNFAALPGWDPTWRCRALRPFQDYMVALNVTKGANQFGNLVKWSDLCLNGLPPASWDATDATNSAGENPLENLATPLVDALPLRNGLVLYSTDEIWAMEPTGDDLIFSFRALFTSGGVMSQDCVVQVNGKHYAFGVNDIYVHDGTSKVSVIDGKNRAYVFGNLNKKKSYACFATYLPALESILFGYCTGPSDSAVPVGNGCNKGAVLDIPSGTWSFVDLPNIHSCAKVSVVGAWTYASTISAHTYATMGGSYWDEESSIDAQVVLGSEALSGSLSQSRLLGYDFNQTGNMAMALCTEALYPSQLIRLGLDMTSTEGDLSNSKLLRRIIPQARVFGQSPLQFSFGSSNFPEGPYTWKGPFLFDPTSQYKIDLTLSGRYLGFKVGHPTDDYDFVGFDADIQLNGSN